MVPNLVNIATYQPLSASTVRDSNLVGWCDYSVVFEYRYVVLHEPFPPHIWIICVIQICGEENPWLHNYVLEKAHRAPRHISTSTEASNNFFLW